MGGGGLLWLHLLKEYCRSIKPTNSLNALFAWFCVKNFSCLSWSMFLYDLGTIANTVETAMWKKNVAKYNDIKMIEILLYQTILPFYLYIQHYQPNQFDRVWIGDMVHPDEQEEYKQYLSSML